MEREKEMVNGRRNAKDAGDNFNYYNFSAAGILPAAFLLAVSVS